MYPSDAGSPMKSANFFENQALEIKRRRNPQVVNYRKLGYQGLRQFNLER
jgi:hypothetical protein